MPQPVSRLITMLEPLASKPVPHNDPTAAPKSVIAKRQTAAVTSRLRFFIFKTTVRSIADWP